MRRLTSLEVRQAIPSGRDRSDRLTRVTATLGSILAIPEILSKSRSNETTSLIPSFLIAAIEVESSKSRLLFSISSVAIILPLYRQIVHKQSLVENQARKESSDIPGWTPPVFHDHGHAIENEVRCCCFQLSLRHAAQEILALRGLCLTELQFQENIGVNQKSWHVPPSP